MHCLHSARFKSFLTSGDGLIEKGPRVVLIMEF